MGKVSLNSTILTDIASAIRTKKSTEDMFYPSEMADEIKSIPTGITPTGTKTITENGTHNIAEFENADVNVSNSYSASDEGKVVQSGSLVSQTSKNIAQNGTHDTTTNNEVIVNVPNSYAASDEGKVVQNGALTAQTSRSVTQNGTYDTTTNNEVVVNVSSGGGGGTIPPIMVNTNNVQDVKIVGGWIHNFTGQDSYFRPLDENENFLDVDWSQPFEIFLKFKISSTVNRSQVLFGCVDNFYGCPSIEVMSNNGGVWCGFTTNGSSWTNGTAFNGQVPLNTEMSVKAVQTIQDGSVTYTVSFFDGTNTQVQMINPSAVHYHSSSRRIMFAGINRSSGHFARHAHFDLPSMYIKQNGVYVWSAA